MNTRCDECGGPIDEPHPKRRFCSRPCGRRFNQRKATTAVSDTCLCGEPATVYLPVTFGSIDDARSTTNDVLPLCDDCHALERRQAAEVNWHYGTIFAKELTGQG